jgi:hypothetical protein
MELIRIPMEACFETFGSSSSKPTCLIFHFQMKMERTPITGPEGPNSQK